MEEGRDRDGGREGEMEREGGKERLREGDIDLSFNLLCIHWLLLECVLTGSACSLGILGRL